MIRIKKKKTEPKELTDFKEKLNEYEVYSKNPFNELKNNKEVNLAVQNSLAIEQGFICCYCMQSLIIENTNELKIQIEHFKPKSVYNGKNGNEDLRIEYSNLLGACLPEKKLNSSILTNHCGQKKDKKELKFIPNPATSSERKFNLELQFVENSGKIKSKNQDIDKELNDILNLNDDNLRENRKARLNIILKEIKKHSKTDDWQKEKEVINYVKRLLENLPRKDKQGKYVPFHNFIIFCLNKKFRLELG